MTQRVVRLPREPWEIALLAAGAVNGVLVFIDYQTSPGALERQLPEWGVTVWAAGLTIGSVIALVGILWPRERPDGSWLDGEVNPIRVSPLLLEQVGLAIFGFIALAHAFAVVFTSHKTNVLSMYEFGMATAAFLQYLRIRVALNGKITL